MATRTEHSLALADVERVWTQLAAVYGQRFLAQYDGMNLAVVKEDWRIRLAGLSAEQLQYAVDNLPPGKPAPDVLEFRRLATAMPDERRMVPRALLAPSRPRPIPERFRAALLQLREPTDEPPHVLMARGYIARWQAEEAKPEDERVRPTPQQAQWIAHYRGVVARYEARQAAKKAEGTEA